jgi:chemotaxis protein MotB
MSIKISRRTLAASVLLAAATGCVSLARYDAAVRDADQAKQAATESSEQASERLRANATEIMRLSSTLTSEQNALQQGEQQLSEAKVSTHNLQAKLDEVTAINAGLRGELTRLGKNVDQLLGEKGTMARSLEDLKARLETLRRAEQAAEARRATLQRLALQLKPLSDAGFLSVAMRDQIVVITVPSDKMFEGPKQEIRATGEAVVKQIALVLKTYPERRFQIRAHADRHPKLIASWDPTAARASDVVRRLVALGVRPEALSAASYAEYDPIAGGDTAEARMKNRRIEIALVPRADELVSQPAP